MGLSFTFSAELNPVTVYSAVVTTAVAAWQVYTYFRSGARLRLQVGVNFEEQQSVYDDKTLFVVVDVANVGRATTTIQTTFILAYDGWWNRLRKKTVRQAWVSDGPHGDATPHELAPGKAFRSAVSQTAEIVRQSQDYLLYIGVKHTMSRRVPMTRIKPISTSDPSRRN